MRSFFYQCLEWIKLACGVMPRSGFGSRKLYLVVHYCFMLLLAVLCGVFNDSIRNLLPEMLKGEPKLGFLNGIWCTIVFVIVYCIIRIVLHLMELMGIEDESDFPDIEDDWHEILEALDRERLPIDDVPLFLVNGLTPQQEQSSLEAASGIDWRVIAPPLTKKSTVLRVFANDDAIYLSCTDIGTTNLQQRKVASGASGGRSDAGPAMSAPGGGVTGTMKAGQIGAVLEKAKAATGTNPAGVQEAASAPPPAAPSGGIGGIFGTIVPGGLKRAMESFSAVHHNDNKGYGKKRLTPLSDMESMLGIRRMEFVCHLIKEARRPYCPINGLLQAVPFSWAEEMDYARTLVSAIRDDVVAIHEQLHLQFPVVVIVTELDDVSGMREFILRTERLQPGLRLSRAGTSFASGADVSDTNAAWVIDRSMQWFRGWVYSAFSSDLDNRDNQKLFNMLCGINQRRDALVSLLRDSLYKVVTPRLRLHGCYFCATGHAAMEQGFIRGVLDKLTDAQGEVAWTPKSTQSRQRATTLGWVLFAGAAVLAIVSVILVRA
ncbi:MAG: type VI secretion protein IcmF/TssM N-terminal domain-containing protein [Fuerstiella sp.]